MHVPNSRPGYNDQLVPNTGGYIEIRSQGDSVELLSVPRSVIEGDTHIRVGWPITHLLHLLGVDDRPGRCYRLTVTSLEEKSHE